MPHIQLTNNDVNEMVRRAVHAVLNESVQEVMGSSMADKEDAIQDIVNYVKYEWARIQEEGVKPSSVSQFGFNDEPGATGKVYTYIVLIPNALSKKLGIADDFELNVGIENYVFDPKYLKYFGENERSTEGRSYNGGGKYDRFNKTTLKLNNGRIDLIVPAIMGELQTKDFHSTLYHELNHTFSTLQVKKKMSDLPDDELDNLNLSTMSSRVGNHPHRLIQKGMNPDSITSFINSITYGKHTEEFKSLNYVFYAIWEQTERNARAEAIYGDLKELNASRNTFGQVYPQTSVARNIREIKKLLSKIEKVPEDSLVWDYAANIMNMNTRGKGKTDSFYRKVKERFLNRSEELLELMYKKAMKVAELYFQRNEPKKEPTRLERYKQEHNR